MCLNGGLFEAGHNSSGATKLTLPADLARRIFVEQDQAAGMQGFMSGQIKVEGDMSKLMAMQTARPSDKQKELLKEISAITE
jgi:putative sterol carrier protein